MKLIIILILLIILSTLASGLYFMMKDNEAESDRMVKALTWRIALSIGLFIFLMIGYYLGWFQPNTHLP